MRVLVTGGAGLLGSALASRPPGGAEVLVTWRRQRPASGTPIELDLLDPEAVRRRVAELRPGHVVHTAYDPADHDASVRMAEAVATACAAEGIPLIHVSSDRVFDGERAPYDESAAPSPIEPDGESKAEAERRVVSRVRDAAIVRTSVIVGTRPPDRQTAALVADLAAGRTSTWYVDEMRSPIHVVDLAAQIWEVVAMERSARAGVWNLAGPGRVSRFELATLIAQAFGVAADGVRPGLNRDSPAPRPRDLTLTCGRADRTLRTRARPISQALAEEV